MVPNNFIHYKIFNWNVWVPLLSRLFFFFIYYYHSFYRTLRTPVKIQNMHICRVMCYVTE